MVYSKLKKTIVGLLLLFYSQFVFAQIASTTPNKYLPLANYAAFDVPTATDAVTIGTNLFQVMVSTSPKPVLSYDDNNGHSGSLIISNAAFGNNTVFLDDITIAKGSLTWVYISCRVFTATSVDMYIVYTRWSGTSFGLLSTLPLDSRPLTASPIGLTG